MELFCDPDLFEDQNEPQKKPKPQRKNDFENYIPAQVWFKKYYFDLKILFSLKIVTRFFPDKTI